MKTLFTFILMLLLSGSAMAGSPIALIYVQADAFPGQTFTIGFDLDDQGKKVGFFIWIRSQILEKKR